jgi:8-oxo-dGTP diphosphatase
MSENQKLFPLVGVDVALFSMVEERLKVLLVKRAREPEAKKWALPGGMLKPHLDHSLEATARRVMADKVAVVLPHIEEVGTYSGPDRDPRGWSVSVLFFALLPLDKIGAIVRNKVEALEWADVASPGHRLAFDHADQIAAAVKKLRTKVAADALPLHLLPDKFTLTQLQAVVEVIGDHPLDKSSFRRRLKASKDLVEMDEFARGAQRPARLFKTSKYFLF